MTDPSQDTIEEPLPLPPASSRRPRRALWGVLAVLAVVAGGLVVRASGDDPPPRLPLALGSNEGRAASGAAPAADMAMLAYVTYVAGKDLPDLGGDGPAYRIPSGVDEAQVRALAKGLGLAGDPVHDGQAWRVSDDTHTLEVYEGGGGTWWFSNAPSPRSIEPDTAVATPAPAPDGTVSSSGGCAPDATTCESPTTLYEPPPPPADLPSKAEARTIALDLLRASGLDVTDANVSVDGPSDAWYVSVEPKVDGRAVGGISGNVAVGDKGEILSAGGVLNAPERVGNYPTITTRKAIDRLNEQGGGWSAYDTRSFGGVAQGGVAQTGVAESGPATTVPDDQVNVADTAVPPRPDTTSIAGDGTDTCKVLPDGSEECSGSASGSAGSPTSIAPCSATDVLPVEPSTTAVDPATSDPATSDPAVGAPYPGPPVDCGEPYTPPEPVEVTLTDAEEILAVAPSSDGTEDLYLVPGYRFHTADDSTVVDAVALADDALAPVQTTVPTEPVPEPGAILPDPGGIGSGTPGSSPPGSGTTGSGSTGSGVQKIDPQGTTPCTLPEPGPNGEMPAIACADPGSIPSG